MCNKILFKLVDTYKAILKLQAFNDSVAVDNVTACLNKIKYYSPYKKNLLEILPYSLLVINSFKHK
jgi:hypothetical protein